MENTSGCGLPSTLLGHDRDQPSVRSGSMRHFPYGNITEHVIVKGQEAHFPVLLDHEPICGLNDSIVHTLQDVVQNIVVKNNPTIIFYLIFDNRKVCPDCFEVMGSVYIEDVH